MSTIKVGDKVICNTPNAIDLTKGRMYTVVAVDYDGDCVTVYDDVNDSHDILSPNFTLVEDSEPLTYKLKISVEGFGASYSKEKEIHLKEGESIVDLISKLNDL